MWSLLFILLNIYTGILPDPEPVPTDFRIEAPLKKQIFLSGNFGELRNNHFHSGLDMKAQPGTPVYCVEDGFVSRVGVSPYGYGYALYIDHPSVGVTTVYGHLDRFAPFIDKEVKKQQYSQESFSVNFYLKKGEIPVKKGQVIAYTGNTGSSGGPHLHFEIRETVSEYLIDPMSFFKNIIQDTRPPQMRSIAVFPEEGSVNGGFIKTEFPVQMRQDGTSTVSAPLTAWGKIVLGVKAYDYMNGTSNIYGVYSVRLFVDNKLVYSSAIDRYSFDKSRMANSYIYFPDWVNKRSFIMRSYVAPGNTLPIYGEVSDRGVLTIDQERKYNIRYELSDHHGNLSVCTFSITGEKHMLPGNKNKSGNIYKYNRDNKIEKDGMIFTMPKGTLYEDTPLDYKKSILENSYSYAYSIGSELTPLQLYCPIRLKILNDTLSDKKQYYLAKLKGKGAIPFVGDYKNGYLETKVREFGTFVVKCDATSPTIVPLSPAQWGKTGSIRFRIGDSQSGVETFRGELDGKFILFEMDGKTSVIRFRLSPERVERNRRHHLVLTVTDRCGNVKSYENDFYW